MRQSVGEGSSAQGLLDFITELFLEHGYLVVFVGSAGDNLGIPATGDAVMFAGGWLSNVGHTARDELLAAARTAGFAFLIIVALVVAFYVYRNHTLAKKRSIGEPRPKPKTPPGRVENALLRDRASSLLTEDGPARRGTWPMRRVWEDGVSFLIISSSSSSR